MLELNSRTHQLAKICEQKFGVNGEKCLLCPTRRVAEACRSFIIDRAEKTGMTTNVPLPVRLVQFHICSCGASEGSPATSGLELHIVLFPEDAFSLAKQFWQHTGLGISSRLAERCLSMIHEDPTSPPSSPQPIRHPGRPLNKHYTNSIPKNYQKVSASSPPASPPPPSAGLSSSPSSLVYHNHQHQHEHQHETLSSDQSFYVEERYGRNMPLESAAKAKRAMRRRIAGVLVRDTPAEWKDAGTKDAEVGPSTRGVSEVTEDDVFLFPTGMSAIWSAHQLALAVRPRAKSICFGYAIFLFLLLQNYRFIKLCWY